MFATTSVSDTHLSYENYLLIPSARARLCVLINRRNIKSSVHKVHEVLSHYIACFFRFIPLSILYVSCRKPSINTNHARPDPSVVVGMWIIVYFVVLIIFNSFKTLFMLFIFLNILTMFRAWDTSLARRILIKSTPHVYGGASRA